MRALPYYKLPQKIGYRRNHWFIQDFHVTIQGPLTNKNCSLKFIPNNVKFFCQKVHTPLYKNDTLPQLSSTAFKSFCHLLSSSRWNHIYWTSSIHYPTLSIKASSLVKVTTWFLHFTHNAALCFQIQLWHLLLCQLE